MRGRDYPCDACRLNYTPAGRLCDTCGARRLRVTDEDGHELGDCGIVALDALIEANVRHPEVCVRLRGLAVGESMRFGGGADPVLNVERLS